jgi:membrane protein required for beta-lactamase induction
VLKVFSWVVVSFVGLVAALIGATYVASTYAPDLGSTLAAGKLGPLPASFVLTRSEAFGMIDQSAF